MSRKAGKGTALICISAAVAFAVTAAVLADLAIRAMRALVIGILFLALMAIS